MSPRDRYLANQLLFEDRTVSRARAMRRDRWAFRIVFAAAAVGLLACVLRAIL